MMDKNDEEQIRLIAAELKRSYDHPDKALQAEVERLKKALRDVIGNADNGDYDAEEACLFMRRAAREALKEG